MNDFRRDLAPPKTGNFVTKDAYVSSEFAQREKDKLWPRVWLLACREEEIEKPGKFVTFEIGDESIIIARDDDNRIAAFFNVCPHRGRRLLQGCGRTARFFCRYHGWQWKLSGQNTVMIDSDDWTEISQDDVGLRRVRAESWGGFVFVNVDGKAEPLLDFLGPWPDMWESYRLEDLRYRWFKTVKLDCNWKVAIEAFIEGYHAQTTHRQINPFNGGNLYSCRVFGRHSLFYDRVTKKIGTPNPNMALIPESESGQAAPDDLREALKIYFETLSQDLDCQVTDHIVEAARRLPDRVSRDAPYAEVMTALRGLHVEVAASQGVTWDHLPMSDYAALGAGWHMFPNVAVLPTLDGLVMYRARADGDDPGKCEFDVFPLERCAPGHQATVRREFHERWQDANFPRIFQQDFENLELVQAGMKSAGFRGALPNPIAEQTVLNLHHELHRMVDQQEPVDGI